MSKVLIAGATGLVGQRLVELLIEKGFEVNVLSTRKSAQVKGASVFLWSPMQLSMDIEALKGVDAIINIAGATVNKRWTSTYKQEIYDSRTRTAETLLKAINKSESTIKNYISASAVGIYPNDLEKFYREDDAPGNDFLAQVCKAWEATADKFTNLNVRVVKFRIGMVLSRNGGALQKLEPLTKFGLASPLASGKQWMSWIHIDDLCALFIYALEKKSLQGVFNAVASAPVRNADFTKQLAKALHRPAFLPAVPAAILKLTLGEMAAIVISSQKANSEKIVSSGFNFTYKTLPEALKALY